MAIGYNRIILIGNLTRDPDYKQLSSGQAVCRLSLAANRQFKNRQTGDAIQEVCYIDVDVWGGPAESCRQYLEKGRPVLVEGRLKLDTWKDEQTGQNRSKHSIVANSVVFLSAGASTADTEQPQDDDMQEFVPKNDMERNLLNQIDTIKKRTLEQKKSPISPKGAVKAESPASLGGETGGIDDMDFQDSSPFQDDLPF